MKEQKENKPYCNGVHCKCMNLGNNCPNHHYSDCVKEQKEKQKELEEIKLAKEFHNLYEKYAPEFGYETREETKEFNPESPNGKLMIKVCSEILSQTIKRVREERDEEIEKILDGFKEVYKKGDERFYEESEDGEEKKHIDSSDNELLDDIINSIKKGKIDYALIRPNPSPSNPHTKIIKE